MKLPDVNVYLNALRGDLPHHAASRAWLLGRLREGDLTACWAPLLVSCVRIATNAKAFPDPSSHEEVLGFVQTIVTAPATVMISPGERFWTLFNQLVLETQSRGDHIADLAIAALAMEHQCEVVSYDKHFAKYKGLRWSKPAA